MPDLEQWLLRLNKCRDAAEMEPVLREVLAEFSRDLLNENKPYLPDAVCSLLAEYTRELAHDIEPILRMMGTGTQKTYTPNQIIEWLRARAEEWERGGKEKEA